MPSFSQNRLSLLMEWNNFNLGAKNLSGSSLNKTAMTMFEIKIITVNAKTEKTAYHGDISKAGATKIADTLASTATKKSTNMTKKNFQNSFILSIRLVLSLGKRQGLKYTILF